MLRSALARTSYALIQAMKRRTCARASIGSSAKSAGIRKTRIPESRHNASRVQSSAHLWLCGEPSTSITPAWPRKNTTKSASIVRSASRHGALTEIAIVQCGWSVSRYSSSARLTSSCIVLGKPKPCFRRSPAVRSLRASLMRATLRAFNRSSHRGVLIGLRSRGRTPSGPTLLIVRCRGRGALARKPRFHRSTALSTAPQPDPRDQLVDLVEDSRGARSLLLDLVDRVLGGPPIRWQDSARGGSARGRSQSATGRRRVRAGIDRAVDAEGRVTRPRARRRRGPPTRESATRRARAQPRVASPPLTSALHIGHYAFVVDESSALRVRHAVAADGAAIAETHASSWEAAYVHIFDASFLAAAAQSRRVGWRDSTSRIWTPPNVLLVAE